METEARVEAEGSVRRLCDTGDFDTATTLALRAYGSEVMSFLCALLKNEDSASNVFSLFAEDLWRGMAGFSWKCSLRTWAYTIARRASFRAMRKRRPAERLLGSSSAISQLVQQVRTETVSYLRTEKKTRLRALRESLPREDQVLLMLRVDRGLSWDELARVLSDGDTGAAAQKREAARLRKRFQLVKERLKSLAQREGLYPSRERGDG